jgi:hypothetical protein
MASPKRASNATARAREMLRVPEQPPNAAPRELAATSLAASWICAKAVPPARPPACLPATAPAAARDGGYGGRVLLVDGWAGLLELRESLW